MVNKSQPGPDPAPRIGFDAKKIAALSRLALGESPPKVAAALGLNRVTVWRWAQEPEFAATLADIQRDFTEAARKRLRGLTLAAVDTLEVLLESEDTRAALGAANSILDRAGLTGRTEDADAMNDTIGRLIGEGKGAFVRAQGLVLASIRTKAQTA